MQMLHIVYTWFINKKVRMNTLYNLLKHILREPPVWYI